MHKVSEKKSYLKNRKKVSWLIVRLIEWWISRSIDWLVDWSIDRLIDWLIDRSIDWLIDWLVVNSSNTVFVLQFGNSALEDTSPSGRINFDYRSKQGNNNKAEPKCCWKTWRIPARLPAFFILFFLTWPFHFSRMTQTFPVFVFFFFAPHLFRGLLHLFVSSIFFSHAFVSMHPVVRCKAKSLSWNRGVPMASRRGQIFLADYPTVRPKKVKWNEMNTIWRETVASSVCHKILSGWYDCTYGLPQFHAKSCFISPPLYTIYYGVFLLLRHAACRCFNSGAFASYT